MEHALVVRRGKSRAELTRDIERLVGGSRPIRLNREARSSPSTYSMER